MKAHPKFVETKVFVRFIALAVAWIVLVVASVVGASSAVASPSNAPFDSSSIEPLFASPDRFHAPFGQSPASHVVLRAGHALIDNYGYDGRVRPLVARWVNESAIPISAGERRESRVPRSAKSKPSKYEAAVFVRVSRSVNATKTLATGTDEAVFWSGVGPGGDSTAAAWAAKNGGATLESTMAARGVKLPVWDGNNPASVAAWRQASADFASGASGNVRVLQGISTRVDSVWASVEFPALKANPNVRSITAVNPTTGQQVVLWTR